MNPDDPANLRFRPRIDQRRKARDAGERIWWVVTIVGALVFALIIRALLARTSGNPDPSPPIPMPMPEPAAVIEAPAVATPQREVPMVYRCVDAGGAVSLQSQPCGPGQRTTRAVPAPPDIEPRRAPLTRPAPVASNGGGWSGPSASQWQRQQQQARCAQARAEREATLERVGLRRDFDLLRRLDDMVREACKGQ